MRELVLNSVEEIPFGMGGRDRIVESHLVETLMAVLVDGIDVGKPQDGHGADLNFIVGFQDLLLDPHPIDVSPVGAVEILDGRDLFADLDFEMIPADGLVIDDDIGILASSDHGIAFHQDDLLPHRGATEEIHGRLFFGNPFQGADARYDGFVLEALNPHFDLSLLITGVMD